MSQFYYKKILSNIHYCLLFFDDALLSPAKSHPHEPGTYSANRPGSCPIALNVSAAPAANSVSAL